MAKCFDLTSGYLVESSSSVEDCTGFVVMDASTYQEQPTLAQIFNVPEEGLPEFFAMGFTAPFLCYFAAWGFQQVIKWFDERSSG